MTPMTGLIRTSRRLGRELGISLLAWSFLLIPGYRALKVIAGPRAAPDLIWHIVTRYSIYAILSVVLLEYALLFPFQRGRRLRAVAAHMIGLPSLMLVYAWLRVLALQYVHGMPIAVSHQFMRQTRTFLLEQTWWYCAVVILAHVVFYQRTVRERDVQEASLRAELARQQMQILRLQLHPHFLFNALHGISSLMDTDIAKARTAMAHFSDLLRTALTRTSIDEIALRDEIAFIESYLALERLRLGERLTVTIEVPRSLHDAVVPTMVLQPLVENAIRHGIEKRRAPGSVEVRVWDADGTLRMRVVNDTGPGATPGAGIGLQNTRGRLRALYSEQYDVAATARPDGRYEVEVSLPLRRLEERRHGDAA